MIIKMVVRNSEEVQGIEKVEKNGMGYGAGVLPPAYLMPVRNQHEEMLGVHLMVSVEKKRDMSRYA